MWWVAAAMVVSALIQSREKAKDRKAAEDVPENLKPFWEDLYNNWFGENGDQFKQWLFQDLEYQKNKFYGDYIPKTEKETREYKAKLADLEKTYTNEPYTFNFRILGQDVKNIPKRSLMTIDTLSGLAGKSYRAGIDQADRKWEGDKYFTPNRGQKDYMDYLMRMLGMQGYKQDPEDKSPSSYEWLQTFLKGLELYGKYKDIGGDGGNYGETKYDSTYEDWA